MSPVQGMLPCTHRFRIAEQIDSITHRWPSQCVHCGLEKSLSGGDPANPFIDGTSWGRKLGELGKSGVQTAPSKQANRSELVLNPTSSQAYMARERAVRIPKHGTLNEYNKHGCRCEPCVGAARENTRRVRDRKRAAMAQREAMGIDWMNSDELSQAIPPAYCEFIGKQLLAALAVQP